MNGSNNHDSTHDNSIQALSQLLGGRLDAADCDRLQATLKDDQSDLSVLLDGIDHLPTSMLSAVLKNSPGVDLDSDDALVEQSFDNDQLTEYLQTQVRSFLDDDVLLHQIDNRTLIEKAYGHIFAPRQVDLSVKARFFEVAGRALADVLATVARERAARSQDAEGVSPPEQDERDTVAAGQTTLADSIMNPARVLSRADRLDKLRRADARLATVYTLSTFSGRTSSEVSQLLDLPLGEVEEAIEIAQIEVCLDD